MWFRRRQRKFSLRVSPREAEIIARENEESSKHALPSPSEPISKMTRFNLVSGDAQLIGTMGFALKRVLGMRKDESDPA